MQLELLVVFVCEDEWVGEILEHLLDLLIEMGEGLALFEVVDVDFFAMY